MSKRPFNKDSYDLVDMPSKLALSELMKSKGYELISDINKEEYKKYDLNFKKGDSEISFEIEVRLPFEIIKTQYDTIHIPIRKANNQSTWYVVFNVDYNEFALIETAKIRSYAKNSNLVDVNCNEGTEYNYVEEFIDIPKEEWDFYRKVENKWVKEKIVKVNLEELKKQKLKRVKELLNKKQVNG